WIIGLPTVTEHPRHLFGRDVVAHLGKLRVTVCLTLDVQRLAVRCAHRLGGFLITRTIGVIGYGQCAIEASDIFELLFGLVGFEFACVAANTLYIPGDRRR